MRSTHVRSHYRLPPIIEPRMPPSRTFIVYAPGKTPQQRRNKTRNQYKIIAEFDGRNLPAKKLNPELRTKLVNIQGATRFGSSFKDFTPEEAINIYAAAKAGEVTINIDRWGRPAGWTLK